MGAPPLAQAPSRRGGLAAAAALALALLAPGAAGADAGEAPSATPNTANLAGADQKTHALRLRFAEGRALQAAGRWADALERFQQIARVRPTPHVLFHVALCHDELGRLHEAARVYRQARDGARVGAPDVLAEAEERLRWLDLRMPRALVTLDGEIGGVTLRIDGAPVPVGEPVRLDPGPHVLVAMRGGVPVAAAAFSASQHQTRLLRLRIYSAAPAAPAAPAARALSPGGGPA